MPLVIAEGVEIPDDELTFTASRSGGPGGQHVNKTESKVTVRFDDGRYGLIEQDDVGDLRVGDRIQVVNKRVVRLRQ